MDNCPFCKIIKGEIPAKKIYEDDSCTAILDIYPANPGHILLLSKNHHQSYLEISEPDLVNIGIISKKISENIIRAFKPDGLSIFIADGEAAGQRAPHFILHIIPRFENDGLPFEQKKQEADTSIIFEKLKPALLNIFPAMDYDKKEEPRKEEQPRSEHESKESREADLQASDINFARPAETRAKHPKKEDGGMTLDDIKDLFEKEEEKQEGKKT